MKAVLGLVHAWLLLDFFGESRTRGADSSTLTTTIFGQSVLGFVVAALLFPDVPLVAFAAANLSVSTLLVGIGTLAEPDRLARLRADRLLTGTAPLSPIALACARLLHGGFHLALVTVGVALSPAILAVWLTGSVWVALAHLVWACVLAGLLAGTLSVLLLAAAWRLGPLRAQLVAGSARALLLGGLVVGFFACVGRLRGGPDDLPLPAWLVAAWPPYRAARWLADPAGEAWVLAAALGAGLVLLAAHARLERLAMRPRPAPRRAPRATTRLEARLAGPAGPLLGVTGFVAAMLTRSPGFRAKVLPLAGVPAALVLLALLDPDPRAGTLLLGITLQFPAIYLPILVAFLPAADQERTAWVFETSPAADRAAILGRKAALLVLFGHVLAPLHAAGWVLLAASGVPPLDALILSTFSLGVAVLAAEVALRRLDRIPFTAEDADPRLEAGDVLAFGLVLALAGGLAAHLADSLTGAALAAGAAGLAAWRLREARRVG